MAVSTIANDLAEGIQLTTILNEGAPTVQDATDGTGGTLKVVTFASPLKKNDFVVINTDTGNTYAATNGLPVASVIATGTLIIGKIISEPQLVKMPANTAAGNTWTKQLAGGYYRIATVQWYGVHQVVPAQLVDSGSNAIVPGVQTKLKADVSATIAAQELSLMDAASGGSGVFSFHYSNTAGTFSILAGIVGPVVLEA